MGLWTVLPKLLILQSSRTVAHFVPSRPLPLTATLHSPPKRHLPLTTPPPCPLPLAMSAPADAPKPPSKTSTKPKSARPPPPKPAPGQADLGVSNLPVARVSKIIKADSEIHICSKEATFLIGVAAVSRPLTLCFLAFPSFWELICSPSLLASYALSCFPTNLKRPKLTNTTLLALLSRLAGVLSQEVCRLGLPQGPDRLEEDDPAQGPE